MFRPRRRAISSRYEDFLEFGRSIRVGPRVDGAGETARTIDRRVMPPR
jgi:hypothetical protein